MSKSRAKKKQRRRARAATSAQQPGREAERAARAAARAQARGQVRPRQSQTMQPAASRRTVRSPSRLDVRDGVPRPDAIWGPFPLTEIGMVVGIALFGIGVAGDAPALFIAGVGVLVVVVSELCLREHFAGFRSHSILLALLPITIVHLGVVYLGGVTWRGPLALALDLVLAGGAALWLQRRFAAAQAGAGQRAG